MATELAQAPPTGSSAIVDPDGDDRRAERELDRLERAAHLGSTPDHH